MKESVSIDCENTVSEERRPCSSQARRSLSGPTNLHVVTCLFNPTRSQRIAANYRTFRRALRGVPVTVVELVYDDDPAVEPEAIHIRGTRERHTLWQKERLLNIGFESLPNDVDAVAWFDADIILPSDWQSRVVEELKHSAVVQPFSIAHWLDSDWQTERTFLSFAKSLSTGRQHSFSHPGFAWAVRREVLRSGLFDLNLVGGADSWMAYLFSGRPVSPSLSVATPSIVEAFRQWAPPVSEIVAKRVSFCDGRLLHLHHGRFKDRRYVQRSQAMRVTGLKREHIVLDDNGLYTIVGNERFRRDMMDYFPSRRDG